MPRESLVELLLAEPCVALTAASRIDEQNAWDPCVRLALGWGVLPRLEERIAALSAEPPPEVLGLISRQTTDSYARSILQAQAGLDVLRRLEEVNVPAVAFKGLASMAILY